MQQTRTNCIRTKEKQKGEKGGRQKNWCRGGGAGDTCQTEERELFQEKRQSCKLGERKREVVVQARETDGALLGGEDQGSRRNGRAGKLGSGRGGDKSGRKPA